MSKCIYAIDNRSNFHKTCSIDCSLCSQANNPESCQTKLNFEGKTKCQKKVE